MARNGRAPALRLEQDHHRRVSRGRLAKPGGALGSGGRRPGRRGGLAPPDGQLATYSRVLDGIGGPSHARSHTRRRCQPPVSFLPRISAGRRNRGTWRRSPMAGGMEMGRHPRPVDPPGRAHVRVVARRGGDLAYPLEGAIEELGDVRQWQVEWKWDGIRAQLIRRGGRTFVWSRGEELMTDRFPELEALGAQLPEGVVVDGEVLSWKGGEPLPFAKLQSPIGRKALGPRILNDVPVVIVAYDLLELRGEDIRERPLEFRRARLEEIAPPDSALIVSPIVRADTWEELTLRRQEARARKVEGFMLKRLGSPYRVGRRRGDWWKWKIEPYSVDAVLIYAQPGHGRRASLFTDYTFGVWDGTDLVPFATAYSGLTDEEIRDRKSTRLNSSHLGISYAV